MQIQKGLVKYKDRSDIVCTYGITDDGKQYYFLDGGNLANGNIIASTVLVEAIDPVVVATSIGVIDSNGNVVIPFENKSIRSITDNLLLVERANSTTPSVVEALKLRSDPLAATKLVTTPATIKDNMNAKMGNEGRFLFNDQFSDATICDTNGNNLVNNEYYSFIGIKNNDALFFSKNTVDSPVDEFSLVENGFVVPPAEENSDKLDVGDTAVTKDVIDGAMNSQEQTFDFGAEDITAKDFEKELAVSEDDSVVDNSTAGEVILEDAESEGGSIVSNDNTEDFSKEEENKEEGNINLSDESLPIIPEVEEDVINNDVMDGDVSVQNNETDNTNKLDESFSVTLPDISSDESDFNAFESQDDKGLVDFGATSDVVEGTQFEEKPISFDFNDNINYLLDHNMENKSIYDVPVSYNNKDFLEVDLDTDIFADSVLHADKIDIDDTYNDFNYRVGSGKDTIIEDVATTMSNLISLNRSQKQKLVNYEEKFAQAAATHKKVVEKVKSQIRDMEVLKAKLKNYDTIVAKLEAKVQVLENKVHEQDKMINSQLRELESLRPQVEGKEELVRILADAQNLLEQSI